MERKWKFFSVIIMLLMVLACGTDEEPTSKALIEATNTAALSLPTPTESILRAAPQDISMISPVDGMVQVFVPEGFFLRGSSDEEVDFFYQRCIDDIDDDCKRVWFEREQPQRSIYLNAFWIDQTEVTNAQFAKCVDAGACEKPLSSGSNTRDSYYSNAAYDDYPVIHVSWKNADTYCRWAMRRLPTEAEWEKAARGVDGRIYPWGDRFDGEKINFCDNICEYWWKDNRWDDGYFDTAPVGSYPAGASPYGALDMAGNVWEWVADWYDEDYYRASPDENPLGPSSGDAHMLRGGSWNDFWWSTRSAMRDPGFQVIARHNLGFRCASSP